MEESDPGRQRRIGVKTDMQTQTIHWKTKENTRIPYGIYGDPSIHELEQERIFKGSVWNYLCLEVELPEQGSYRTTYAGETPVVVVRG